MSLIFSSARRVDLLGLVAVLITVSALIATVVLLTVAPRAEPGLSVRGSAAPASVWSIASGDPRDGGYVGDERDVPLCDPSGNCRVP